MGKKGQAYNVLKYIFIAFIIMLIQLMGFNAIRSMQEADCNSDLIYFKDDVENIGHGLSYGSSVHRAIKVPCKSDRVYFTDNEQILKEGITIPSFLIQDSIKSGISKNVFLTKESMFENAFESKRVGIDYPHYLCLEPKGGRVSLLVKM